jgi:hypothetical protein
MSIFSLSQLKTGLTTLPESGMKVKNPVCVSYSPFDPDVCPVPAMCRSTFTRAVSNSGRRSLRKEEVLKKSEVEMSAAILAAIIGGVLYFREETVVLGYHIPHYVGLILSFCGILWFFYVLFANR